MNKDEFNLKYVDFYNFYNYFALELTSANDYNFGSFYKLFELINNDENIKKFNNINNKYDLLDFVNYIYNNNINIKLYYNCYNMLVSINNGEKYYDFVINIEHKMLKNYKNMFHFIGEFEEFINNVNNID